MSTKPNDPVHPTSNSCDSGGMTIREEFAKAFTQGLLAGPESEYYTRGESNMNDCVTIAVKMADLLINKLNETAEDSHE